MFTGIVDHVGTIEAIESGHRFSISTRFSELTPGESISVDGVCLTVIEPGEGCFTVEVSPETFAKTIMGSYSVGDEVNLERALRPQDRMGGHAVSGHVDGRGVVTQVEPQGEFWKVTFGGLSRTEVGFLLEKGSIAVMGTSLTINEVTPDGFSVMLIPHTLERTNLHRLKPGLPVNLEFDAMMKLICRQVQDTLDRMLTERGLT